MTKGRLKRVVVLRCNGETRTTDFRGDDSEFSAYHLFNNAKKDLQSSHAAVFEGLDEKHLSIRSSWTFGNGEDGGAVTTVPGVARTKAEADRDKSFEQRELEQYIDDRDRGRIDMPLPPTLREEGNGI